jgi:hypothetical protein
MFRATYIDASPLRTQATGETTVRSSGTGHTTSHILTNSSQLCETFMIATCNGLQTVAPGPTNKGCFGLTFGANR